MQLSVKLVEDTVANILLVKLVVKKVCHLSNLLATEQALLASYKIYCVVTWEKKNGAAIVYVLQANNRAERYSSIIISGLLLYVTSFQRKAFFLCNHLFTGAVRKGGSLLRLHCWRCALKSPTTVPLRAATCETIIWSWKDGYHKRSVQAMKTPLFAYIKKVNSQKLQQRNVENKTTKQSYLNV